MIFPTYSLLLDRKFNRKFNQENLKSLILRVYEVNPPNTYYQVGVSVLEVLGNLDKSDTQRYDSYLTLYRVFVETYLGLKRDSSFYRKKFRNRLKQLEEERDLDRYILETYNSNEFAESKEESYIQLLQK